VILYQPREKNAPVIRLFSNFDFNVNDWQRFVEFYESESGPIPYEIRLNESGKAALVIVLDSHVRPFLISVPVNRIVKLCREPQIDSFWTHRFTYHHERYFSHVFMRGANPNSSRERELFPIIFGISFRPQKLNLDLFQAKRQKMSIISSLSEHIPGHQLRNKLISEILYTYEFLSGHVYGRGREKELGSKIDGLLEYQYSLAVENSIQQSYISEKFSDCILAGVVPVYLGAPNVGSFFPAESFVQLKSKEHDEIAKKFETLTSDGYRARIPALVASQSLLATKYNLISLIELVLSEETKPDRSRWTLLFGLDALLSGINVAVSILVSNLPLSLRSHLRKALAQLVFGKLK
jgi:hypothetical protein